MKYLLIAIIMGTLALVSVPTSADSGVAVNATTIIVGGSGGGSGGGNWDYNDPVPYSPPNWSSVFPSMNQPQSSSSSSSYIPVQQPVEIPPVIAPQSQQYVPPAPVTPAAPASPVTKFEWIVLAILVAGSCLIGLVVWIISKFTDAHREDS